MRISNKTAVQSVLFHLQDLGIRNIVYSPGSRNAPFAIGLDGNPNFDVHIKVDERSAAFYALGIAQQTHKPVVLICTSGTAPLNYAPALAEAFYQEIPLIVITADRPFESINQSEGQCINQVGIYNNFIKRQCSLIEEANSSEDVIANHALVGEVILDSIQFPKGPVHINVPFYEPLYLETDNYDSNTQKTFVSEQHAIALPVVSYDPKLSYLVLMGQNSDASIADWVKKLVALPNVMVMTETHSNGHAGGAIDCIDRWVMAQSKTTLDNLHWDVVISLGHNIISRKIKTIVRQRAKAHWSVQWQQDPIDTYRLKPQVFNCSISQFLKIWLDGVHIDQKNLTNEMAPPSVNADLEQYFSSRPFSDLKLFHVLSQTWPIRAQVQMGNSSVVRYIQLFDQRSDLSFFGNRGVSGIDGSTSTAVGAAVASSVPVVFVTGDLSFLYDANGLWHSPWPANLKIIVVDNGGGGIFKIIDGAKNEPAVPYYFETPHKRDLLRWVEGWGLKAKQMVEPSAKDLEEFFSDVAQNVLIIKTSGDLNPIELDLFFEYFKQQNERVENN